MSHFVLSLLQHNLNPFLWKHDHKLHSRQTSADFVVSTDLLHQYGLQTILDTTIHKDVQILGMVNKTPSNPGMNLEMLMTPYEHVKRDGPVWKVSRAGRNILLIAGQQHYTQLNSGSHVGIVTLGETVEPHLKPQDLVNASADKQPTLLFHPYILRHNDHFLRYKPPSNEERSEILTLARTRGVTICTSSDAGFWMLRHDRGYSERNPRPSSQQLYETNKDAGIGFAGASNARHSLNAIGRQAVFFTEPSLDAYLHGEESLNGKAVLRSLQDALIMENKVKLRYLSPIDWMKNRWHMKFAR